MSVRIRITSWPDTRTPAQRALYAWIEHQRWWWRWEQRYRTGVQRRIAERLSRRVVRSPYRFQA